MARPTKYTFGRIKRLLKYLRTGGSKSAACGAALIHVDTLYDWEQNHAGFSEAVKRSMLIGERRLLSGVLFAAHNLSDKQSLTASMFLLNTVHGYARRTDVEHSGEMTVKHERTEREIAAERELARLTPTGRRAVLDAFRDTFKN